MIQYSAKTNIGQRKVNEDSFFVDENLGLYIVADGVGGLAKGEVASSLTCEVIYASVQQGRTLEQAVCDAHNRIIESTQENEQLKGMASTVVVAKFNGNSYELAWVGDSRAYLWDGGLKLITRDHSYIELLLETGHISYEQMKTHPDKNVISQALGIDRKKLKVATNQGTLEKGQILMLSTDGLYEIAHECQVIKQISNMISLKSLTNKLVNYAVNSEGKDNITLLTIQSDTDTDSDKKVIQPLIIREFDTETGEVIVSSVPDSIEEETEDLAEEPIEEIQVKKVASRAIFDENNTISTQVDWLNFVFFLAIIVSILVIITLKL
jgi:protein phosphatase